MQSKAVELLVGLFVCLGIAAIFVLTLRVSDLANSGATQGYTLTASFNDVGGLKVGAPVDMAGVRIGRVTDIKLNQTTYRAVATLQIQKKYKIPKGSDASILTSGLLGDQYIGVGPGGSMKNMQDGDKFVITQSAIVLENLIGQFMTSMNSGPSNNDGSGSGDKSSPKLFGPAPGRDRSKPGKTPSSSRSSGG